MKRTYRFLIEYEFPAGERAHMCVMFVEAEAASRAKAFERAVTKLTTQQPVLDADTIKCVLAGQWSLVEVMLPWKRYRTATVQEPMLSRDAK